MTQLVYAARNWLAQQPSVTSLLGVDELGDPMIYANRPEATIENTGSAMVVLTVEGGWGSNQHNDARFPVLTVDIWADPTRNPDKSVKRQDADLKVEAVYKAIDKFLHLTHASTPGGGSVIWGTEEQVENKTGVRIISSVRDNEPDIRPAIDDQGALIGIVRYNISI